MCTNTVRSSLPFKEVKYTDTVTESGLLVFKIIEGQLSESDVQLEVLMDDHVFPSYTSQKVKTKHAVFNDGRFFSDIVMGISFL